MNNFMEHEQIIGQKVEPKAEMAKYLEELGYGV